MVRTIRSRKSLKKLSSLPSLYGGVSCEKHYCWAWSYELFKVLAVIEQGHLIQEGLKVFYSFITTTFLRFIIELLCSHFKDNKSNIVMDVVVSLYFTLARLIGQNSDLSIWNVKSYYFYKKNFQVMYGILVFWMMYMDYQITMKHCSKTTVTLFIVGISM